MSKAALWIGRVLSALCVLFLLFGATMALTKNPQAMKGLHEFGYPDELVLELGAAEAFCAILYAIPQTSVLGAILLTGYLGGAVATHARIEDPKFVVPIIFAIIAWLGIYLRESRLRSLVPLR